MKVPHITELTQLSQLSLSLNEMFKYSRERRTFFASINI